MEKSEHSAQVYRRLREILAAIRRKKGWKQRDLSERLGVSQSMWRSTSGDFASLTWGISSGLRGRSKSIPSGSSAGSRSP